MEQDAGRPIDVLNVDGGASANNLLMQFQADILDRRLARPQNIETTALGAAYLAGLTTGFWKDTQELKALRSTDDAFVPQMDEARRKDLLDGWAKAIGRTIS
jgi:glycerol kinase